MLPDMPPKGRKSIKKAAGIERKKRSCRDTNIDAPFSPKHEVKSSPLSQASSNEETVVAESPFEWQVNAPISPSFKIPKYPIGRSALDPQVVLSRVRPLPTTRMSSIVKAARRKLRSNVPTNFCVSIPVARGCNMPLLDDEEFVSEIHSPFKTAQARIRLTTSETKTIVLDSDETKQVALGNGDTKQIAVDNEDTKQIADKTPPVTLEDETQVSVVKPSNNTSVLDTSSRNQSPNHGTSDKSDREDSVRQPQLDELLENGSTDLADAEITDNSFYFTNMPAYQSDNPKEATYYAQTEVPMDIEATTTLSSNDLIDFVNHDHYIGSIFQLKEHNENDNHSDRPQNHNPNKLVLPNLNLGDVTPISPIIDLVQQFSVSNALLPPVSSEDVNTPNHYTHEKSPIYTELLAPQHYSNGDAPTKQFWDSQNFPGEDRSNDAYSTDNNVEPPSGSVGKGDLLQQALRATFLISEQVEDPNEMDQSSMIATASTLSDPEPFLNERESSYRRQLTETEKESYRRKHNIPESTVALTKCKFEGGQWTLIPPLPNRKHQPHKPSCPKANSVTHKKKLGRPKKRHANPATNECKKVQTRRKSVAENRNKKLILKIKRMSVTKEPERIQSERQTRSKKRRETWQIDLDSSSFMALMPNIEDDISIPTDIEEQAYQMADFIAGDDTVASMPSLIPIPIINPNVSATQQFLTTHPAVPITFQSFEPAYNSTTEIIRATSTPYKIRSTICPSECEFIVREPNGKEPLQPRFSGDSLLDLPTQTLFGVLDLSKSTGRNFRHQSLTHRSAELNGVVARNQRNQMNATTKRPFGKPYMMVGSDGAIDLSYSHKSPEQMPMDPELDIETEIPNAKRTNANNTTQWQLLENGHRNSDSTLLSMSVENVTSVTIPDDTLDAVTNDTPITVGDETLVELLDDISVPHPNENDPMKHVSDFEMQIDEIEQNNDETLRERDESNPIVRKTVFNFDADFDYEPGDSPESPMNVEETQPERLEPIQPKPNNRSVDTRDTLNPLGDTISHSASPRPPVLVNNHRFISQPHTTTIQPDSNKSEAITEQKKSKPLRISMLEKQSDLKCQLTNRRKPQELVSIPKVIEKKEIEPPNDVRRVSMLARNKRELQIKINVRDSDTNINHSPDLRTISIKPSDTPEPSTLMVPSNANPGEFDRQYERGPVFGFDVESLLNIKRTIHVDNVAGDGNCSDNDDVISLFAPSIRSPSPRLGEEEFLRPADRSSDRLQRFNTNPLQTQLPDLRLRLKQQMPRRLSTIAHDEPNKLSSYKIPRRNSCIYPSLPDTITDHSISNLPAFIVQTTVPPALSPVKDLFRPPTIIPTAILNTSSPLTEHFRPNNHVAAVTGNALAFNVPTASATPAITLGSINAIFGHPCFRYMRGNCVEPRCKYKHTLPDPRNVFAKLQTISLELAEAAYGRFVVRHKLSLEAYFETFCQFFGDRQCREKLVTMVHDCEQFVPPYIHFYRHVVAGLIKSGLFAADAVKLIFANTRLHTPDAINELVEIMTPIGISQFCTELDAFCNVPNFTFKPNHINNMVDIALMSKNPHLVQVLYRVIKMKPGTFSIITSDRVAQFLVLLNEFTGNQRE